MWKQGEWSPFALVEFANYGMTFLEIVAPVCFQALLSHINIEHTSNLGHDCHQTPFTTASAPLANMCMLHNYCFIQKVAMLFTFHFWWVM